jgi:hypothetical protein
MRKIRNLEQVAAEVLATSHAGGSSKELGFQHIILKEDTLSSDKCYEFYRTQLLSI